MPVEFALRPRIRLREAPPSPRRARARLPRFALPALAYWLAIGGLVYEFVSHHDPSAPPADNQAALAPLPASPPPAVRQWWRPLPVHPAPESEPAAPPAQLGPAAPEPEPQAPSEPPVAELSAPQRDIAINQPESPTAAEEAPLASEAPLATMRAPRRARTRDSALPRPAPPPAAETTADLAPNNVGVPAPPLEFAPLDEPVPAHAFDPAPTPPTDTARRAPATSGLPSCESAIASASQDIDFSGNNRAADLPTQAIAAVLQNGGWLTSCNVPEHTALDVCVAIKNGRVVGATVNSRPADSALNQCVKRRASSLQFPFSPHLDVARTRF